MKKLITIVILLASCDWVSAQRVSFGLKAGFNRGSVSSSVPSLEEDKKSLIGFHAGVVADIPLSTHFALQPQLVYNVKGTKIAEIDHTHTLTFTALDVPVYGVYKITKSFFVGAGPSVGVYLSGQNTTTKVGEGDVTYRFGQDKGQFQRVDVGANLLAGYAHSSGFFASATYTKGLKNVYNIDNLTWKYNLLSFSLGYMFHNH